jgi:hypothetical protein
VDGDDIDGAVDDAFVVAGGVLMASFQPPPPIAKENLDLDDDEDGVVIVVVIVGFTGVAKTDGVVGVELDNTLGVKRSSLSV